MAPAATAMPPTPPASPGAEYPPSEDTFLVADVIGGMTGSAALDMGSGSGYLARLLCGGFALVVGTDISHPVLRGQTYKTDNLVCCNGADALQAGSFDLIVCNMPYLATDTVSDAATDGGPGGVPVPLGLIRSAVPCLRAGGRLVFVTSSLSDHRALIDAAAGEGLAPRIVARKRLFFEELIVVEARAPGRRDGQRPPPPRPAGMAACGTK